MLPESVRDKPEKFLAPSACRPSAQEEKLPLQILSQHSKIEFILLLHLLPLRQAREQPSVRRRGGRLLPLITDEIRLDSPAAVAEHPRELTLGQGFPGVGSRGGLRYGVEGC